MTVQKKSAKETGAPHFFTVATFDDEAKVYLDNVDAGCAEPPTDAQLAEMRQHLEDINYDVAAAKEKEIRHDVMAHVHAFGVHMRLRVCERRGGRTAAADDEDSFDEYSDDEMELAAQAAAGATGDGGDAHGSWRGDPHAYSDRVLLGSRTTHSRA